MGNLEVQKFSRRDLLKGVSIVTLILARPDLAKAWSHGSVAGGGAGFNNGKTQLQSYNPNGNADFPFINLLKMALPFSYGSGNGVLQPSELDSTGYPLQSAFAAEVFMAVAPPLSTSRQATAVNPFVVTWVGNCSMRIGNIAITFVSGSQSAVLNGYGYSDGLYHGRYVFYPTYDATTHAAPFNFVVTAMTTALSNAAIYFLADETAYLGGEIFGTQYKSILQQLGPGAIRFMDWLNTNNSTTTNWASRKSYNYPTWAQDEYRASLYPGDIMTNTGNAYALTTGSFTLADRLTMHVHFPASSTFQGNCQNGLGFGPAGNTLTVTNPSNVLTFGWTSHPFSNGSRVQTITSGNAPNNSGTAVIATGINYYVVNATTNTFQISTTSGGSAITANSLPGLVGVIGSATLSLNSGAAIPIVGPDGFPLQSTITGGGSAGSKIFATIVYEQSLGSWLMTGGTSQSDGLSNGVPIEVCLQLCKEIGAHPHFSIPYLCLDPMTDYVPSLASYLHANQPSWMIPRFESGNETWNSGILGNYVTAKVFLHWGGGIFWTEWNGMTISTMGQAVAAVYGIGNLKTGYKVYASGQTDGFFYPVTNSLLNSIFTSAQYVANGPSQAGYTQTAASGWCSTVLPSTYVSPALRGSATEVQLAYDWTYTNPGSASDLNAYVDTLSVSSSVTLTNASANVTWTSCPLLVNQRVLFPSVGTATGVTAYTTYWVTSVSTNSFQFSATQGGTAITPTVGGGGTTTGTAALAIGFTIDYEAARWFGMSQWASGFGITEMHAYEGGYSPDLIPSFHSFGFNSPFFSNPESTLPTRASQCVVTINNWFFNDGGGYAAVTQTGNPYAATSVSNAVGLVVSFSGSGMPELACINTSCTITSGTVDITCTSHNLHPNQRVLFGTNTTTNITAGQFYYVISTNLTTNTFQVSATKGGSAITPSISGGGTNSPNVMSGFTIVSASGTSVTIDVDSTGFAVPTASMTAYATNSLTYIDNFRIATLLNSTHIQSQMTTAMNTFATLGGTFFSQYQLSGNSAIWPPIQPDIYGTLSGEYAAIKAYNGH